ncbi:hypothetical protein M8C21_008729 [Ambrosia artemisiifolia]|uniref:Peptidase A1 domain-containing protein n=1 Tax=Ambrosia artemisiifolia TaxID=4212 RepID=A0AAD5CLR0_AMBAR|nr:hypothetical protein M8C21_008729 [Ambrosia artemisiifolia]
MTTSILFLYLLLISVPFAASTDDTFSGAVFGVSSKFSGKERSLSLFKAHDNLRHLQILASGVDLPLGGTGRPDAVGCGARQSGNLGSTEEALDGILGFGKSNSSIISQLASSGKVKKMFAHCLDGDNGGGIFAIGHVVQPKVNSTPLIPDEPHYSANVVGIEVGTQLLNLSTSTHGSGNKRRTIIDSGTTLAYLPDAIYKPLVNEIAAGQPDLRLRTLHDQYTCFDFSGSVDDVFPAVYPHDYLFAFEDSLCFGWQNNGLDSISTTDTILLGGSSTIKLRDEITGSVHLVGPHSIPSSGSRIPRRYLILFLIAALLHQIIS